MIEAPVAMGCMRLSTEADRDDEHSVGVLHAALDAGVRLLDTANAYCLHDGERGHNERLIAKALSTWDGEQPVTVATKGGLTRPDGRWEPDGRAKHLRQACVQSLRALEVECIDLYQLHAVDPKTKLETSVRALEKLRNEGLVDQVGLCNVNLDQLRRAQQITNIDSVQIELGPHQFKHVYSGLLEYCSDEEILVLAYRPLGGVKRARKLREPDQVLAWIRTLGPIAVLPGPTRVETAVSSANAQQLEIDTDKLDARYPVSRILRLTREQRRPPDDADGEVVLIMGFPAAGKSTHASAFVDAGYERLNRDERGGSLRGLVHHMQERMKQGLMRLVLDNTYGSRAARAEVIETAWRFGIPVRAVWIDISLEDAQINMATRMYRDHGKLLDPETIRKTSSKNPRVFPPRTQFEFRRSFEPPLVEEGYSKLDVVTFERRPYAGTARAVVFNADTLDKHDWSARLRALENEGWLRLVVAWQPEEPELEGFDDVVWCPHVAGPPICWCRKPIPGLAVVLIERHQLDPRRCVFVGTSAMDRTFAARSGFPFKTPAAIL